MENRSWLSRRAEMHLFLAAIEKVDIDVPKIVLGKFSSRAFKANERTNRGRAQIADQLMERRLGACVPGEFCPSQDLDREQLGLRREQRRDKSPKRAPPSRVG